MNYFCRRLRAGLLALAGLAAVGMLPARDAYVLLSGGGTPLTNNFSQYLQAREVAKHLRETYPPDSVWVFFGIGNRDGEPAQIADVRKQVKEKGLIRETWQPGPLPNNRPARKAEFLKALREEILPAVNEGGTLYLFVGDHGTLTRTEPKESVVTMWQLEDSTGKGGWRTNPDELLSVTDLRKALQEGLGKGRVVFCMTQCHSGGFHYVGVPRAVLPSTNWFTAVPDWAIPVDEKPLPLAAGFTATDEESLAAGCDPDPDPERWAGYERFIPEALLGVDFFSHEVKGPGLPSYAAAHEVSVLIDQTIDKPRSSSEQYLERWATLIDKLATEEHLTTEVKAQVAAYQVAVNTGFAEASDPAFAARRAQFERFLTRMTEQNTAAAELLKTGTREQLEQAGGIRKPAQTPAAPASTPAPALSTNSPASTPRGGPSNERLKLWTDTIRPAWKAAVEAKKVRGLRGDAWEFEKYLLEQEAKGRNFTLSTNPGAILNDLYWRSGYAQPATLKKKKAEAVTRWGAVRRAEIFKWAQKSKDPAVREAVAKLLPRPRADGKAAPATTNFQPPRTLSRKIAAERTLFYRRTLAAWAFLLEMKEDAALAQLEQLIELENTPLPVPTPARA